jgi:plastocyanin
VSVYAGGLRTLLLSAALSTLSVESPMTGRVAGQLTLLERPGAAATKDLATAVIYLQPLDARSDDSRGDVSNEATIVMRGREFIPHTAVIRSGGSVAFPNDDPFSHNVFSNTEPGSFDLGLYRRGTRRVASFAQPGVFPIYCNIHARMVSYVIAVPSRHVTTADADGRFTLDDIPIGSYRLVVWHERSARLSQEVVVTAAGAAVRLTLDARGYIPGAHLNKFGMPYSSTRSDRY